MRSRDASLLMGIPRALRLLPTTFVACSGKMVALSPMQRASGCSAQLPNVRSDSVPARSRDLDYVVDDGNNEEGGYNPGIQRVASAAGKTRCSGALGPPEVRTPLSISAETMRCALPPTFQWRCLLHRGASLHRDREELRARALNLAVDF